MGYITFLVDFLIHSNGPMNKIKALFVFLVEYAVSLRNTVHYITEVKRVANAVSSRLIIALSAFTVLE